MSIVFYTKRIPDSGPLQAMKCLCQAFWGMGSMLLQPPLHKRDLRTRQIVCQHIKRDDAVGFDKGGAQIGFNFLRALVTHSSQDQRTILALEDGI